MKTKLPQISLIIGFVESVSIGEICSVLDSLD
jgi:hypothetical protein